MKLAPTTRLAIQAVTAIAITSLISYLFNLERAYWAVITSFFMISQTSGESIKRSLGRLLATIIGGSIGTLIYLLLPDQSLYWTLLILNLFLWMYFSKFSYFLGVLFLTIAVIFLYGIIFQWDSHLLEVRIYEILIGIAVGSIVSYFVLPIYIKDKLGQSMEDFLQAVIDGLDSSFKIIRETLPGTDRKIYQKNAIENFYKLSSAVELSRYESISNLYRRDLNQDILIKLKIVLHYTTNILQISPRLAGLKVPNVGTTTLKNLAAMHDIFQTKKSVEWLPIMERAPVIAGADQLVYLDYLCFYYYIKRMNEILEDVAALLNESMGSSLDI